MAYDAEKLSRVKHLKDLAERIAEDFATKKSVSDLSDRVDQLVTAGGEPNVITAVKVNGETQTVTDKAVNIVVPTAEDMNTAVSGAIDNLIDGAPETYDTLKEIAEYIEEHKEAADALAEAIGQKVSKEDGKGLSTEDFTTELKDKLEALAVVSDAEVQEMLDEVFGNPATQG